MKTLNKSILENVKNNLDNANWDYEFSNSAGSDIDKSISYLNGQTFSISKISEILDYDDEKALEEEDIRIVADADEYDDCYNDEAGLFLAGRIADKIALDRISKFNWAITETVTFKLN